MATNRSQIYIDTIDNSSKVIQDIAKQIQALQGNLQNMGNASQNGFNQMNSSLNRQISLLGSINSQFENLGSTLMGTAGRMLSIAGAVIAIKKAGEELFNFFKEGVQINIDTETTKIGISGLLATLYDFKRGAESINGMDKLNTSLVLTETVMKRLRIAAIETGASFDEVVEGYRNAVGGGAKLGIDPVRLEKLSTLVANAAKGFGLDKGQTGQETRALFSGKIDKSAQIGSNLQFGPGGTYQKQYQEALKKGGDDFAKFLEERLSQFSNAGKVYAETVGGIFDQIADSSKLFKGDATKGLSDELKKLKPIADSIFKNGDFTDKLDGLTATLQGVGSIIGKELVAGFESFVNLIFDASDYLANNQELVNGIVQGASLIGDVFGLIVDILGTIFGVVGDVVTGIASMFGITQEQGKELDGIQLTMKIINGAVAALNIAFGLVKDTVSIVASSIRVILGGAIDYVMTTFGEFIGAVSRTAGRLGLDNVAKDLDAFQQKVAKNKEKAMEVVIGADNRLFNAPDASASAMEKINFIFQDTFKALDKSADKFDKANQKENSSVAKYLKDLEENRKKIGQTDPRLKGVTFSSNKTGDEKDKKGGGRGDDITNELLKGYEKELEAFKKGNDFKRKENELYYQNYKKTVEQFYNEKQTLDEADYKKQLDTYNKEISIVKENLGTKKTKKENEALEVKLLELVNKRENAEKEYNLRVQETIFAREKDIRRVQETIDTFKSGIDELLGNKYSAGKIRLDIEIGKLNLENQNNQEMQKLIPIYQQIKEFKLQQEQQNTLISLSEERLNILKENGALSQIDYYKQVGKLNEERLKQYEAELALIQQLAPNEQDNIRIKELQNLILQTRANLDPLAKDISKTFQDSFGTFFSDVIGGTKSIKDAFKDMVSSIEQMLSKLVAQKLTEQLFGGGSSGGGLLGGLMGGSSGGGSGSFFNNIGGWVSSLFGMATGGFMQAGMPYKVGEGGTELFIPSTSGYMMNASRTADFLNGGMGSGGGVTNINVSLQTPNATSFNNSEGQIGAMLNNALRKAQRNM